MRVLFLPHRLRDDDDSPIFEWLSNFCNSFLHSCLISKCQSAIQIPERGPPLRRIQRVGRDERLLNFFAIPDGRKGVARNLREEVVVQDKSLRRGERERTIMSSVKPREGGGIMVLPALSLLSLPEGGFIVVG